MDSALLVDQEERMVQRLNSGESMGFVLFVFLGDNRWKQHFLIKEECHGQKKLICFYYSYS